MSRETELVEPLCRWFQHQLSKNNLLLIHEEASGRGGRRPDLLVVVAPRANTSVDEATMIPVEIENSTKGAIHDRRNGLRQLRKYPGQLKFLAIPRTIARRYTAAEIRRRCTEQGVGLLVVDPDDGAVELEIEPERQDPYKTLRTYRTTMGRWISLRNSGDSFRRISHRRIFERF